MMLGCPPIPLPAQHQTPEVPAKAPAPSSAQIRPSSIPLPLLFPCQVPFTPNPLPPCLSSQGRKLCSLISGEISWSLGLTMGMSPASPADAFPAAQDASTNLTLPRARHGATPPNPGSRINIHKAGPHGRCKSSAQRPGSTRNHGARWDLPTGSTAICLKSQWRCAHVMQPGAPLPPRNKSFQSLQSGS